MRVKKSKLAELAGVSRAAVTQATRRGDLVEEPNGQIDTARTENSAWVIDHCEGKIPKSEMNAAVLEAVGDVLAEVASGSSPTALPRRAPYSPKGEAVALLSVFVTIEGEEYMALRHSYDADDRELPLAVFSLPKAIRIEYGDVEGAPDGVQAFELSTDEPLPTRIVVRGAALELVKETCA